MNRKIASAFAATAAILVCFSLAGVRLSALAAEKESKKSASAEKTPTKKVEVTIADWKQTLEMVARHKGKVVVLDCWSTSCVPCVKEFPNLVKLHKKHGGKDVACMSMACEYIGVKKKPPESYRDRVLAFLEKQEATFENVLSNVPTDELFDQMKLASIPAVYVFDRDGKLYKRFDNEMAEKEEDHFTYEQITQLVEELIARKAS
jgi:thiol-disulfide isomerase/thioredoxin